MKGDTLRTPFHTSAPIIDLNVWHRTIHQVTGEMALCFNRATPTDLRQWAKELQAVAEEMAECAAERRVRR
jgi:hypothetical protein